jgi:hypothetical protein
MPELDVKPFDKLMINELFTLDRGLGLLSINDMRQSWFCL